MISKVLALPKYPAAESSGEEKTTFVRRLLGIHDRLEKSEISSLFIQQEPRLIRGWRVENKLSVSIISWPNESEASANLNSFISSSF